MSPQQTIVHDRITAKLGASAGVSQSSEHRGHLRRGRASYRHGTGGGRNAGGSAFVCPVYAPSINRERGHLLFLREDTLMARQFDTARLELVGEPVALADRVLFSRTGGYFGASSTGVLAYRNGATSKPRLAWFDRDGKPLITSGESAPYNGVSISPDGTRLAVGRRGLQDAQSGIWLVDVSPPGTSTKLISGDSGRGYRYGPLMVRTSHFPYRAPRGYL